MVSLFLFYAQVLHFTEDQQTVNMQREAKKYEFSGADQNQLPSFSSLATQINLGLHYHMGETVQRHNIFAYSEICRCKLQLYICFPSS